LKKEIEIAIHVIAVELSWQQRLFPLSKEHKSIMSADKFEAH